jgi:hypothetical protein
MLIQVDFDGGCAVVPAQDGKIWQFLDGADSIRAAVAYTQQLLARLLCYLSPLYSCQSFFYLSKLTLTEVALSYLLKTARYASFSSGRTRFVPPCPTLSSCSLDCFAASALYIPVNPVLLIQVDFDGGRAVVPAQDGKLWQFLVGTDSIRVAVNYTQQLLARLFRCFSPLYSCQSFIAYPS